MKASNRESRSGYTGFKPPEPGAAQAGWGETQKTKDARNRNGGTAKRQGIAKPAAAKDKDSAAQTAAATSSDAPDAESRRSRNRQPRH